MLNLTLSWDLSIIVFFAIVMSYSFLIGKDRTVTMIVATYIAFIATLGVTNVLSRLTLGSDVLSGLGIPIDGTMIALAKIFFFALCIIIFITRGGIELTHNKETGAILSIVYTALLGFSLSGLVVTIVLSYAGSSTAAASSLSSVNIVAPLIQSSTLMQLLAVNQDLWFTLPAFLIVAVGLVGSD